MALVTQRLQQVELGSFEQVQPHQQYAAPPSPPPPGIGLPPGMPMPGLRPAAHAQAQQVQQPPLVSLQELRVLIDGSVSEEAARLAEIDRAAAEASAAQEAARQERRAAKKAAQKVGWAGYLHRGQTVAAFLTLCSADVMHVDAVGLVADLSVPCTSTA